MSTYQHLMDTLGQMQSLYSELIALGELKREQVVQNRLGELAQTLTRETKALKRLAELDHGRLQAIQDYQREIGLRPDPSVSLEDLVKITVKPEEKRSLAAARAELAEEAETLRKLNETNHLLVKQALDFVNYTLDLFTGMPEDEVVYQAPKPSPQPLQRRGIFDTRA